ncbi:MAG: DUF5060 domain-containing protein [Planctomycetota bacterium]
MCLAATAHAQTVSPLEDALDAWKPLQIDFTSASVFQETAGAANPFLDRRLDVTFERLDNLGQPTGEAYTVPGFFNADGAAADTHATAGNQWAARFTPPTPGTWRYTADFRQGAGVAITDDPTLFATSDPALHNATGTFSVDSRDASAPGFLAKGLLKLPDGGARYLQTQGDGQYWLKGGADSPENPLGYLGFDNTTSENNSGPANQNDFTGAFPERRAYGRLHQFDTHRADFNPGDPTWSRDPADPIPNTAPGAQVDTDGQNLIGALNYLGSRDVNSIYFLPMNLGGDAQDTHPFVNPVNESTDLSPDNERYDVSKLEQWERAFAHAQRQGINLHVVLNEAEAGNKNFFDQSANNPTANPGDERRLYYRELVARFGHHNAITWNISEEFNGAGPDLGDDTVTGWAAYLQSLDPYDHPVAVHNAGTNLDNIWSNLFDAEDNLAQGPVWTNSSMQLFNQVNQIESTIESWLDVTETRGRVLPFMMDEPGSIDNDVPDADGVRRAMLWDIYLSGGQVEWYMETRDQSLEDFRSDGGVDLDQVWRDTTAARNLIETYLPFWEMTPRDNLLEGEAFYDYNGADAGGNDTDPGEVFARAGQVYALYFPSTGDPAQNDFSQTGDLIFTGETGTWLLQWVDPTTGQFVGDAIPITAGVRLDLPDAPGLNASGENDFLALVAPPSFFLPGDANDDGAVDLLDFDVLAQNFGSTNPDGPETGDFNRDGVVDLLDFDLLAQNFGSSVPVVVPEPASAAMLLFSGSAWIRGRRRR